MATKLDKSIKRELEHKGQVYTVTIAPEGIKVVPKGRRNGAEAKDLLTRAARDYASLESRCRNFDRELMADLTRVGGTEYARLAALAYRQSIAANKLAANPDGAPLLFPKEN